MELAPTLLNIYDQYIASSSVKTVTFADCETQIPITPDSKESAVSGESVFNYDQSTIDPDYISVNSDYNDVHIVPHNGSCINSVSDGDMEQPHQTPSTLTSPQGHNNDIKKRPLSISSTSSSNSSTSSLPRHQRKKIAMVMVGGQSSGHAAAGSTHTACAEIDEYPSSDMHRNVFRSESHTSDDMDDSKMSQSDCDSKSSSLERDQDLGFCPIGAGGAKRVGPEGVAMECHGDDGMMTASTYIDKVVAEIVQTERTYVNDLSDIIQVS